MSMRNVKDVIVEAWEGELRLAGTRNPHAVALKLAVIVEAHGVRLARPALLQDPVANDWSRPPEVTEAVRLAADHAAGAEAAKALIAQRPACPDRQAGS